MALVSRQPPIDACGKDGAKLEQEETWDQSTYEGTTLGTGTALTSTAGWNDFDHETVEIDGFWRAEIEKRAPDEPVNDLYFSRFVAMILLALQQAAGNVATAIGGTEDDLMKEVVGLHPMLGCEVMPAPIYEDETDGSTKEVTGPQGNLGCEVMPAPFYEDEDDRNVEVDGYYGHLACEGFLLD